MKCGAGFDSSAGIATGQGLDGQSSGFEFIPRASCTMGTGSFPGVKRSGLGADPPSHLAWD